MKQEPGTPQRWALGVSYLGGAYRGWQSQPGGATVQDALEQALSTLANAPAKVVCAGRTDAGVHGINQVVHFDTLAQREPFSWVRGTNAHLPADIAVQWAKPVGAGFHARNSARGRRYAYIVLESAVRPALEAGRVGWSFRELNLHAMQTAAGALIGEHDFSSFRSSMCQSPTPIKTLREIRITRCSSLPVGPLQRQTAGAYWRFEFEGQAFLHHMVRNIMGCLLAIGTGVQPPHWMQSVLQARDRRLAAPTFAAAGLYFLGPSYDPIWGLPERVPAMDWLPN